MTYRRSTVILLPEVKRRLKRGTEVKKKINNYLVVGGQMIITCPSECRYRRGWKLEHGLEWWRRQDTIFYHFSFVLFFLFLFFNLFFSRNFCRKAEYFWNCLEILASIFFTFFFFFFFFFFYNNFVTDQSKI